MSGKILSKSIALLNSVDYQDPYFIPQKVLLHHHFFSLEINFMVRISVYLLVLNLNLKISCSRSKEDQILIRRLGFIWHILQETSKGFLKIDLIINDKNRISCRGRIRPLIWDLWSMDPDIRIFSDSLSHQLHVSFLKQSRFCLILRGRKVNKGHPESN